MTLPRALSTPAEPVLAVTAGRRTAGAALLATAATGLLAWLGTGLHPLWPLLWVAPLPVLVLAPRVGAWTAGAAALVAWLGGALNLWSYFRVALQMPVPAVAGILLPGALAFALDVLLFRALLRRGRPWAALLAFPAAWVSVEYLVNLASPHGTAASLAYSQLDFLPLLQVASLTGPWGMTFLVLLFPAAVAASLFLRRTERGRAIRILAASGGVIAAALAFGAVRLASPPPGEVVKVALLVAENAGVRSARAGPDTARLLRAYAARAAALAGSGVQVVVLPEKLGEAVDPETREVDAALQSLADATGAAVVAGLVHVVPGSAANEARVYAPGAAVRAYDKQHLLRPFESRFRPGVERLVLEGGSGRWGVAICKDMDFTPLSRDYGRDGVGLMLVPGLDFVVDGRWHGHKAVMRGVESGFAVARSARQGLLTLSDDRGRIRAELASDAAPVAMLVGEVPAGHERTLYLVLGDWFAWGALAALGLCLARLALPRMPSRPAAHAGTSA